MKKVNIINSFSHVALGLAAVVLSSMLGWSDANAVVTDISTAPIFTLAAPTDEVKPNIMFVMDDSGSMGWHYMPDEASAFQSLKGHFSSHCNGVYYNPNITYTPPLRANGTSYPNSTWPNADRNGFDSSNDTVNLATNFKWSGGYDSSPVNGANYYIYSGTQTSATQKNYRDTTSVFSQECRREFDTTQSYWTHVIVSETSGPGGVDERVNFANWFTYYRTRMLMMKTGVGQAFGDLDDKFRVGYLTLNNASPNNDFLNISDFDSNHKTDWYEKLYEAVPNGGTPLRETLAEAGLVYSGRASTINGVAVTDPVQFACQRNYTILSTDGYWNGNEGFKIDGSSIDDQDGTLPLPYNDGGVFDLERVTTYTSTEDRQTVTSGFTTTETYQNSTVSIGDACSIPGTLTPPPNTTTAWLSVRWNRRGALGTSASTPNANRCHHLGGDAWFCRGGGNWWAASNPPVSQSVATDSVSGDAWYLVSDGARDNPNCVSSRDAFGGSYSRDNGVCKSTASPAVAGSLVTVTPETSTRTISGETITVVDRYIATQTTTQNITATTTGSVGPLTPAVPVFTYDSQLSNVTTAGTATPLSTPVPGTSTTSCMLPANIPTSGTPVLVSSTTAGGTTVGPTVIASTSAVAGTPVDTLSNVTEGEDETLADVAAYYYKTDLREWDGTGEMPSYCEGPIIPPATTARNLCLVNKVPGTPQDPERSQHMTTFTLGLGAQGNMTFIPDYETNTQGDYDHVAKGKTKSASTCSWTDRLTFTGGRCNWPIPEENTRTTIDDLWHTAINGHGNYFNANDPQTLTTALNSSLNTITNTPQAGSASASATTSPQITSENNFLFKSYYKTLEWSGELIRQTISLSTGAAPSYNHNSPDPASYDWSAQTLLDSRTYSTRVIYTKDDSANSRIAFDWASLSATQKQYFQTPHISTASPRLPNQLTGLTQFCTGATCLSATAQASAQGQPLVQFIKGDTSNQEGAVTDPAKFFRRRVSILGDIVGAEPIYVGAPRFSYTDAGYSTFKANNANRKPLVFAAANDGMIHAFDASNGVEDWAYIPGFVLPRLYTLADKNYANKHQYFVEGTPATGDVYDAATGTWKTILVGGFNAGGVGYYALDITDPADPKVLWEFDDTNMGYSFGNPNIVRLDDGSGGTNWAVTFTSGYNNCPITDNANCTKATVGDGQGHLYVIGAISGSLLSVQSDISTAQGTTTNPTGLAKTIAVSAGNGEAESVYGGDLWGNLWRFDINSGSYSKHRIATFLDALGNAQPVTAKPEATRIDGKFVVFVGTGRYLGTSDKDYTLVQSFYAIKDTGVDYGDPRNGAEKDTFIRYAGVPALCPTDAPVDVCNQGDPIRSLDQETGVQEDSLRNKNGWYVDFPVGEISFTEPELRKGTISFSTSLPRSSSTEVCGDPSGEDSQSFLWQLNFVNGQTLGGYGVAASFLGDGIASRTKYQRLPNGTENLVTDINLNRIITKMLTSPSATVAKRMSWRELLEDQ